MNIKEDLHILIKDLPVESDRVITTLANLRGKRKWEIIREALIEYAHNHKIDIAKMSRER